MRKNHRNIKKPAPSKVIKLKSKRVKKKKNKVPLLIVAILLVLGIPSWYLYNHLQGLNNYIVTAQPSYFSLEPDNFAVATKLIPMNTTFQNPKDAGNWYEIEYENQIGYASKGYMINYKIDDEITTASYRDVSTATWIKEYGKLLEHKAVFNSGSKKKSLTVTEELKMREDSNTNGRIILAIPKGHNPMYIGENGDWYRVFYDGNVGYINKGYVKITEVEPTPEE